MYERVLQSGRETWRQGSRSRNLPPHSRAIPIPVGHGPAMLSQSGASIPGRPEEVVEGEAGEAGEVDGCRCSYINKYNNTIYIMSPKYIIN